MVPEMRKQDIRPVLLDDFANLVQALKEDVVNFAGRDCHILDKGLGGQNEIVKTLLCLENVVLTFSGDNDLIS